MTMKKKIYIVIILLLTIIFACDDGFLDKSPYDGLSSSMIFNSDANATMAINGVYTQVAQTSFNWQFFCFITNIGPEGLCLWRAAWGMSWTQGLGTIRDARVLNYYRNFYRPISYANAVISGLEENEMVSEDLRGRIIGEAKFLRALCYFYLYNIFGDVVIIDEPILSDEQYKERSPKNEVIELVISDLTDAIGKLPVAYESGDLGRVTKGAAIAMLGKVYLYEEQWADAAGQFEKLLSSPYTYELVDNFGDNFYWQTQNNSESVFELQFNMEAGLGSDFIHVYGNRVTGGAQGDEYSVVSQKVFKFYTHNDGSPIDFSTMPPDEGYPDDVAWGLDIMDWYQTTMEDVDKRLHQSVIIPGSTYLGKGGVDYKLYWPYKPYIGADPPPIRVTLNDEGVLLVRKFLTLGDELTLGEYDGPANIPVIRFADVLLMYAEAKNEVSASPGTEVYNAINRVKTRAGIVNATPGLSKEEMRREIRLERFREFMFEGILYFDVRRWRTAHTDDPVFGLNGEEWDFVLRRKHYETVFNESRDYLWPIPGQEIDINSLMTQNPGW